VVLSDLRSKKIHRVCQTQKRKFVAPIFVGSFFLFFLSSPKKKGFFWMFLLFLFSYDRIFCGLHFFFPLCKGKKTQTKKKHFLAHTKKKRKRDKHCLPLPFSEKKRAKKVSKKRGQGNKIMGFPVGFSLFFFQFHCFKGRNRVTGCDKPQC
jgi:hypothetical protein